MNEKLTYETSSNAEEAKAIYEQLQKDHEDQIVKRRLAEIELALANETINKARTALNKANSNFNSCVEKENIADEKADKAYAKYARICISTKGEIDQC